MVIVKKIARPAAKTAKVKFVKGVVLGPGCVAAMGEIYELPKGLASQFVAEGRAEYTDEGDPSEQDDAGADAHKAGYSTVTFESASDRDPKPKRKG